MGLQPLHATTLVLSEKTVAFRSGVATAAPVALCLGRWADTLPARACLKLFSYQRSSRRIRLGGALASLAAGKRRKLNSILVIYL